MDELEPRLCGAKTRDGDPCKLPPVTGATRCRMHGGSSLGSRQRAAEREVRGTISREVERLTVEPVTDPARQLAEMAAEAISFKNLARDKILQLEEWESTSLLGVETVRAVVVVYTQAMRDAAQITEKLLKYGVDSHMVTGETERPSREQAETLSRVLDRAVSLAGFDHDEAARLWNGLAQALHDEGLV